MSVDTWRCLRGGHQKQPTDDKFQVASRSQGRGGEKKRWSSTKEGELRKGRS